MAGKAMRIDWGCKSGYGVSKCCYEVYSQPILPTG